MSHLRLAGWLLLCVTVPACAAELQGIAAPVPRPDPSTCITADPRVVERIQTSLDDGLSLANPIAIEGGILLYVAANVVTGDGVVKSPPSVWVADQLDDSTTYSASDGAMSVSLLPDGRDPFGIEAVDHFSSLVQGCVPVR